MSLHLRMQELTQCISSEKSISITKWTQEGRLSLWLFGHNPGGNQRKYNIDVILITISIVLALF